MLVLASRCAYCRGTWCYENDDAKLYDRPVMAIPAALTAASTHSRSFMEMGGTPASSGFGLVGFVSPLAAFKCWQR